ncbi:2-hydroxyacid dehydrogenase [Virgibacillus salexigens]|uniref:Glyoxylate/hydroxypyruvate reductase B n=2 Tax=Virgibacillus TaxID=84406 RepID=A0A024QGK7_9BACI|nr:MULTISPECIES: D-glycerate dehydrogenase [Virgibacillus]MYL43182.1 bifunctional glyoxylate/hydroxypyruvate reductase B [Virgibacillus massiliensis]GGJ64318.1 bifunctional glyoxylate/hydroxypyruvate reductase B [Virgibacillus kapii]CDQ41688.1 Glyoxylate/hydroxypyruvate reductase B [Virgibacillus massiliensis]
MNILAFQRVEKPVLDQLKQNHTVRFFKNVDTTKDPEFLSFLNKTDGIIGLDLNVDQPLINQAPNLKIVSNVSVGYNNLDIETLTKRNIMATNTPGILTDTVADMVFGLILSTARRLPELDHYVKSGNWIESLDSTHYGTDVHHKTVGIIGMGRIGLAIAQRAHHGFDMKVIYHSRTKKPEAEERFQARYASLDELLRESDFVCLITPLTKETERLIGKREFSLMKNSAIFINGSRGRTVVEEDLIQALNHKEIAGAGLDVFENEPIQLDNPLLQMKNVVTLPHIGSSTLETELAMSTLAAKNLQTGLEGKKPPNLINSAVWDNK